MVNEHWTSLSPSTAKLGLITSEPERAGTTRPVGALNERKVLIKRLEASGVTHATSLFKLELDISDQTASTVVVMFDDTTTELVKCSADSIMQAEDEVEDSEEEMASAWNGAQENVKDDSASEKRKKRRYIVDESDSE
ncbi:hypothetical protein Tco_0720777, partial [Tanacetum coccineum]